ncbi:MAG: hypothetical protein IPM38_05555 [Ignavibacteria bacterium]|nr:hypothetical protein [Ignavibacteria bacterium]
MRFNSFKIRQFFVFILFIISGSEALSAGDSALASFSSQNKKSFFTSFSFGMGISYSDNPSLLEFIEFDVIDYLQIPNDEKIPDFTSGIFFFGSAERQILNDFSLKGEYSYTIKTINVPYRPNYQYSYYMHQPMLTLNYLIPQKHSYFKFGLGGGYNFSDFTRTYITAESDYKSSGPAVKFELVFNAQLGKNSSTYLSGFLMKSFMSDLKNSGGSYLKGPQNSNVNLSSFGVGVKLGLELYFF